VVNSPVVAADAANSPTKILAQKIKTNPIRMITRIWLKFSLKNRFMAISRNCFYIYMIFIENICKYWYNKSMKQES